MALAAPERAGSAGESGGGSCTAGGGAGGSSVRTEAACAGGSGGADTPGPTLAGSLRLVGHSGGSSPNTRTQIKAATRVDARLASAPIPASIPDHSNLFTNGLSAIRGRIQSDMAAVIDACRSPALQTEADRLDDQRLSALEFGLVDRDAVEDPAGQDLLDRA